MRRSLFEADDGLVRIGRYELRQRLGSGAMGQVHLAFDPQLRREVALKVLSLETEAAATAVTNEARALARLEHPGIVRVFDVGSSDFGLFIAMERLDGITLDVWARSSKPSIRLRLRVLVELARALAAAHEGGLVHRDVKPKNVVIEPDGRAVLVDFGLAANVDIASPASGTPAYMPPEQYEGAPATPRADQYAWAVMAWELLYGSRPFAKGDPGGVLDRKQATRLARRPLNRRVPTSVHRGLVRALSPMAQSRWPSMQTLVNLCERPGFVRRSLRLGTVAVVLLGVAFLGAPDRSDGANRCSPPLAWPRGRGEVRNAILGNGGPVRRDVWDEVSTRLDAAAIEYTKVLATACTTETTTTPVSTARIDCLSRWSKRFEGAVSAFTELDPDRVPDAVALTIDLADPASCVARGERRTRVPPAPARLHAQVEVVRGELERARQFRAAGAMETARE
ncbi:MAG: serine/threonine protein kinase, partial [Nannocystaceae bacterium]|nr:serine/threonine protein kinase [Nannocystaceae bacterium]